MTAQIDIPGYSMVHKIAEGGMAEVWKARQEQLDRVVAIKVLHKQPDTDHQEYARFIYEARAAATLIHPNVVQVIDAGEFDEFLYYVMEYVPGPTAGDVVDHEGALSETRVLKIAEEVAEALQYAWRDHKVVHCDIKPDNLLLHRNGRTKIADLGLAQVLGKDGVGMDDDMTLGTPNYFPPEQALVEDPLDCRTDMYALGATMYHLATGVVPFGELTPDDVASEQVHGQLPNPKEINPKLTWGFCCLVERLMAKKTDDRYAEWAEVISDLQAVQGGKLIRSPLSAAVKSTIIHTRLPSSLEKSQKIIERRMAATRPIHLENGNTRPRNVRVNAASIARARQQAKETITPPETIWPQVIGLIVLAGMLYAWTFFK